MMDFERKIDFSKQWTNISQLIFLLSTIFFFLLVLLLLINLDYFFQLTDLSITGNIWRLLYHLPSLLLESIFTSHLTHIRSLLYLCITFHEQDCSQNTQVVPIPYCRTVPWDHCEIPRCLLQFSQDSSRERAKNMDEDEKFDLILKFREMVRFYLTSVFDEFLILIY